MRLFGEHGGPCTSLAFRITVLWIAVHLMSMLSFGCASAGVWNVAYDTPEDGVYSLAVYNGKLFAGTGPNGVIYVYDGNTWEVSYSSSEETIKALLVYDGKLYAGGDPNGSVFVYDGVEWSELDDVPGEPICSFAVYGGKLYAGTQNGVFVYEDGVWSKVWEYGVASLEVYNNKLYAGSYFSGAVYVFDGVNWNMIYEIPSPNNSILSLATYNNRLYIGTSDGGAIYVSDGSSYAMSYDVVEPYVQCLEVYADNLFAGTVQRGSIYTYNGTLWTLNYSTPEDGVLSLAVYGTRLYAGTGNEGRVYCLTEFDFSVDASPDNLELVQNSVSTTVSVGLVSRVAESVSLSGSWVGTAPTGVTASFSNTSGVPPFTSTLTFAKDSRARGGSFTYRITAAGGGLTRTKYITVNVVAPPSPPSLLSPQDNVAIEEVTPTFDWSDVAGTASYTLEIATDNRFTNVIITKTVTESTATLSASEALSLGTTYYWRVRGSNAAGVGDWSSVFKFVPMLAAPKVTGFGVVGGAVFTRSNTVELSILAQNAAEMSFSTDMVTWTGWEPYQSTRSYTLTGPEGFKMIYVRVRDNRGNVSSASSTSITLDQTPPLTHKDLVGDLRSGGYRGSVVITLSAIDTVSGVDRIFYRIDGGEWKVSSGNEVSFPITSEGTHTVEYYSIDLAGNKEGEKSFSVKVYLPSAAPGYVWLVPGLAIVAGLATFYATRGVRFRRRLASIRLEKEELLEMKKNAEMRFYKEASMSREAFNSVMEEYRRRMVELEEEEKMLLRKMGKKGAGGEG